MNALTFEEEEHEGVQRVLVHMVDAVQVGKHEIKHRRLRCGRSIHLARLVDLFLGHLPHLHSFVDFFHGFLRRFEALDQWYVTEDVFRGVAIIWC